LSYHLERRALGARKFFFALKENTGFNDDFGLISRCIKQNKELARPKKKTKDLILRGAAGVGLQKNLRASTWLKKSQLSILKCAKYRHAARCEYRREGRNTSFCCWEIFRQLTVASG
jgi:hypothetical protein